MEETAGQESGESVTAWEPDRTLRRVDRDHARLSRGFLRSRPEKWFPGFAAQWLALSHSLGCEIKVIEVQPVLRAARDFAYGFTGSVDGELAAVLIDASSARVLTDTFVPGSAESASQIVLEYLARRLFGTLALSWSGPESSTVRFEPQADLNRVNEASAVKLSIVMNNNPCTVWIVLGRELTDRLDLLWRKQLRSSRKQAEGRIQLSVEIGQLAIAPAELASYMRSGTMVDMETPLTDICTVRLNDKPWMPARLCQVEGRLGIEILAGAPLAPPIPDGMTRLAVELASLEVDGLAVSEIAQIGAVNDCGVQLTDQVQLVMNGEKIASATLGSYEGRFALTIG